MLLYGVTVGGVVLATLELVVVHHVDDDEEEEVVSVVLFVPLLATA